MKLIALAIALAILPIHKSFTGSPESSSSAPAYTAGQARYFNLPPGGMPGNLVVVRENGRLDVVENRNLRSVADPARRGSRAFLCHQQPPVLHQPGRPRRIRKRPAWL